LRDVQKHAGVDPTCRPRADRHRVPEDAFFEGEAARTARRDEHAPRHLLRQKGTPYFELQLDDPKWSDADLLQAMQEHPILINRPIVVTELGTKLCRPSEEVLELLPVPRLPPFTKEDGEVVKDDGRRRV